MAIRLDPRRLSLLKQLAGEAGVRPGELVTHWIEERLDAERSGTGPPAVAAAPSGFALESISRRLDELAQRVDQLSSAGSGAAPDQAAAPSSGQAASGRRRAARARASVPHTSAGRRVPLHEEIASVIAEGGPMSAADIARAIVERGRYSAPRSDRPLDAATVNSRVSNPTYRSRFQRAEGKIGLSNTA
jgi:hypothetical protein